MLGFYINFLKAYLIEKEVIYMKQKILDECFGILILLTFLVGLYWLGGGSGEAQFDNNYQADSNSIAR